MQASTPNTVRQEPQAEGAWPLTNPTRVGEQARRHDLLDAGPLAFAKVIAERSQQQPEQAACIFLADDGSKVTLSYADLDRRGREIAAQLLEVLDPGDRALLVYPAGLEFITAFLGCLYAGIVAVPATHPKPRRPLPRMRQIAEDCGARVALTGRATLDKIDFSKQEPLVRELQWLATDDEACVEALQRRGEQIDLFEPNDTSLAFLQYTSGSTSDPKGVRVSQVNLTANLEAIRVAFGLDNRSLDHEIGVFWLPAYHDMGLIGGVLTPLYVGGSTVLMSPGAFLQNPGRWLGAISEYRATISGAPNFAFDYCVRRLSEADRSQLDLSRWRLAFSGAEPVRAETLHRFVEAFEPCGFNPRAFYPCYGLAEATLLAAGPEHDDNPSLLAVDRASVGTGQVQLAPEGCDATTQELVGCGRAPAGHRLLVIDPQTFVPCEENRVGEVVLWGPSVTDGYWAREDLNATLWVTPHDESLSFLRTGDLGFLHDGELFVTGRLKDVIVLRGANHYPQDIEQTAAEAHPSALPAAAFTYCDGEEERLALVVQVERACPKDQYPEVARAIRAAVAGTHGLDATSVVLIRQGTLPLTSSGKVQRSLTRERYLDEGLRVVFELNRTRREASETRGTSGTTPPTPRTAKEIETWLGDWLAKRLDLEASDLARDRPFAELGVDSLTAVELSGELEQEFGVPLPPVVAWNHPTPTALATYLADKMSGQGQEVLLADEAAIPEPPVAAGPAETSSADAEVEALLAEIENLSDEEAAQLLEG